MAVVWMARALVALVVLLVWWLDASYGYVIAAFICYISSMTWIAFHMTLQLFLPCYYRHEGDYVSLTFDDGPDPRTTPSLLRILKTYNIRATFFLIGERAERYPELVRAILSDGHEIGNHSYSHSYFISLYSTAKWIAEINRCQQVLQSITGTSPVIFRPPYGVATPSTGRAVAALNLTNVGWRLHTHDFFGSAQQIQKNLSNVRCGDVVLLHETRANTLLGLENWLNDPERKDFQFETVSRALATA